MNNIHSQFENNDKQFELSDLHSKYWMDVLPENNIDIISLAGYRRAIGNFVKISTLTAGIDRPIEVRFSTKDESYTDSKTFVVLSSKIKNKEFDSVCGLALHEANHIIYTTSTCVYTFNSEELPTTLYNQWKRLSSEFSSTQIKRTTNHLRNWIEDRRIDSLGMKRSPGYLPYYKALYGKYFLNDVITAAINSDKYRELDVDSYMFRIFNFINPATEFELGALPGLKKIYKLLDLNNIDRLKSNSDSLELAIVVMGIILSNIPTPNDSVEAASLKSLVNSISNSGETFDSESDADADGNSGETSDSESDADVDGNSGETSDSESDADVDGNSGETSDSKSDADVDGDSDEKSNNNENESVEDEDEAKSNDEYEENKKNAIHLNATKTKKLEKLLKEQADFVDGVVKKVKLSNGNNTLLKQIERPGTTLEAVQNGEQKVIVYKSLTKTMMLDFPMTKAIMGEVRIYEPSRIAVSDGIRLGKVLAHKLQLRSEKRLFKTKRKVSGKLDKRLLHTVGFGDTSIFEQTKVDMFGDAIVHISVDASGSMISDLKWENTMTAITAIAYAASKVGNLDVIISFRTTLAFRPTVLPVMCIAYDSRIDSFKKIQTQFIYFRPTGMTPEGLCFEAIMKEIVNSSFGKTGYFINFSDGRPNMSGTKELPESIVKRNIVKMVNSGIKVLSFFITKYPSSDTTSSFQYMYGKSAKSVNVTRLTELAKELNKLFLNKS